MFWEGLMMLYFFWNASPILKSVIATLVAVIISTKKFSNVEFVRYKP